jgi:hypothetical protein
MGSSKRRRLCGTTATTSAETPSVTETVGSARMESTTERKSTQRSTVGGEDGEKTDLYAPNIGLVHANPRDIMEFNPATIRQEIAEWHTTSAATAKALYEKCIRGEITFTEAWHALPGPVPQTGYHQNGYASPIPWATYQHLSNQEVTRIFQGKEDERKQEDFRMDKQVQVLRKTETEKPTELEREIEAARKTYDSAQGGVMRMQTLIEEEEEKLLRLRRALDQAQTEFTTAKQTKERLESTKESILSNLKQTRKEAEEELEATRKTWHVLAQNAKERQEKDVVHIQMLYSRLAQAEKDAKEYEAKAAAEKHAETLRRFKLEKDQKELEQRIEEEVRRRKENAEFERLVAMRMGTQ